MKFLKKSQAALEFIMTYGWAILVVLVAIGALAYFGVLDPGKFLPSRCTISAGIACVDYLAVDQFGPGNGYITIVVKNSLGYDMSNVVLKASSCTDTSSQSLIANGANPIELTATSCSITSGQKYKGDINLTYTNAETTITHTSVGSIILKVT